MTDKVVQFQLTPQFAHFLESVHRQHDITVDTFNNPILALDPGETTGWATFDGDVTVTVGQEPTKGVIPGANWLRSKIESFEDTLKATEIDTDRIHIRCEDYRVYEWKTADHAWSPVHTIRWIGAIELIANDAGHPFSLCMAQHAKGFWTDQKLNHFGINPKGLRHGRDALRHLLYYMCYPTKVN